jgi:hypothetical protein
MVKRPNWKARFMLLASLHLAALSGALHQALPTNRHRAFSLRPVTRGESASGTAEPLSPP